MPDLNFDPYRPMSETFRDPQYSAILPPADARKHILAGGYYLQLHFGPSEDAPTWMAWSLNEPDGSEITDNRFTTSLIGYELGLDMAKKFAAQPITALTAVLMEAGSFIRGQGVDSDRENAMVKKIQDALKLAGIEVK